MRTLKTRHRLSAVVVEFPSWWEQVKQTSVRRDLPVVKPTLGQGDGPDDLWRSFMVLSFSEGNKEGCDHSHAWLWPGLSHARAHVPCAAVEAQGASWPCLKYITYLTPTPGSWKYICLDKKRSNDFVISNLLRALFNMSIFPLGHLQ